jgi:hypothetical protein
MGGTNVELSFDLATEVDVDGRTHAVTRVAFSAHDPQATVALLRTRVSSADR